MADIITPHITQLTSLLSESACRSLKPIKIDCNFIEVSDGFCFDIEGKRFIRNPKQLIVIYVGFLGVRFVLGVRLELRGRGEVKLLSSLKFVRIMLENSNLAQFQKIYLLVPWPWPP